MLDQATAAQIACFQAATDRNAQHPGNLGASDPKGALGRATITAMIMFPVIGTPDNVEGDKTTWENACTNAALVWADQDSLSQNDLNTEATFLQQVMANLRHATANPTAGYNTQGIHQYQQDVHPRPAPRGPRTW